MAVNCNAMHEKMNYFSLIQDTEVNVYLFQFLGILDLLTVKCVDHSLSDVASIVIERKYNKTTREKF